MVRPAEMGTGAAALDFFGDLDCRRGREGGTGNWFGVLGVAQLLISAWSLVSFCSQMMFCRLPTLMDLVVDEFRNVPPETFIGCLTPVDLPGRMGFSCVRPYFSPSGFGRV